MWFDPMRSTEQFRKYADGWRDISGMSDEDAAALVRQDQIDILIDLALHMAGNRLLLFARKPAPVQATFAGYPGSTGLEAMDYRLTDPYLDPPGHNDAFYSEKSIRLPDSFWCYDPQSDQPAVNPLPALANGFVTFGCLNNFSKINEPVLKLWAMVLHAVADSRLVLLTPPGSQRRITGDALKQEGIEPQRVEFAPPLPREQYLELYQRIDIGLDSFPYNGHTTSLDSFWMGVPVVTLVGQTAVARAGWCQLCNLGLQDLAANDAAQFVQIATALAEDLNRLAEMRSTMRQRMQQSPLMDTQRFTYNIEMAYRQMWKQWCGLCGEGEFRDAASPD